MIVRKIQFTIDRAFWRNMVSLSRMLLTGECFDTKGNWMPFDMVFWSFNEFVDLEHQSIGTRRAILERCTQDCQVRRDYVQAGVRPMPAGENDTEPLDFVWRGRGDPLRDVAMARYTWYDDFLKHPLADARKTHLWVGDAFIQSQLDFTLCAVRAYNHISMIMGQVCYPHKECRTWRFVVDPNKGMVKKHIERLAKPQFAEASARATRTLVHEQARMKDAIEGCVGRADEPDAGTVASSLRNQSTIITIRLPKLPTNAVAQSAPPTPLVHSKATERKQSASKPVKRPSHVTERKQSSSMAALHQHKKSAAKRRRALNVGTSAKMSEFLRASTVGPAGMALSLPSRKRKVRLFEALTPIASQSSK